MIDLERIMPGDRVKLIKMSGEELEEGLEGTVLYMDDASQIHVEWDNGSRLAIIPGVDRFELVECP